MRIARVIQEDQRRHPKSFELVFENPQDKIDSTPAITVRSILPGFPFLAREAPLALPMPPREGDFVRFTVQKMGFIHPDNHKMKPVMHWHGGTAGNGFPVDVCQGKNLVIICGGMRLFPRLYALTKHVLHPPFVHSTMRCTSSTVRALSVVHL
jgi:hypothetical protein